MMPKSLAKTFVEFCHDGKGEAFSCGAVVGKVRSGYKNEAWAKRQDAKGRTTDSIDLLNGGGTVKSYSLYRGLNLVLGEARLPIYLPKISLVYDGVKALAYLRESKVHIQEIEAALAYWESAGLSSSMMDQVCRKPEDRNTRSALPELDPTRLFLRVPGCGPDGDAKILNRVNRLEKIF
jgi:hypothetical protein